MLLFKHKRRLASLFVLLLLPIIANAAIIIVAAENVYGNVASNIGGKYVEVTNILDAPQQEPHMFTLTPSAAKSITSAQIIIFNGANYDPWMLTLLTPTVVNHSFIIDVSSLQGVKTGENPHIWYMPEVMLHFAQSLTALLSQLDNTQQPYFEAQLKQFENDYQKLLDKINQLKSRYQNTPVIATEPVFNYMADALHLEMHDLSFQVSNMNDVPPSISDIKQFEDDLRFHNVNVLIYNKQVLNPLTERMLAIAQEEHIPTVGVSEMMPANMTYFQWMTTELDELEKALQSASKHQ